jgi:hypothetical protein
MHTMVNKIGHEISKRRFKEVISMAEVGRIIYD